MDQVRGVRSRRSIAVALAIVMSLLASAGFALGPPAAGASPPAPKLIGPLLSTAENPKTSWGRDGGLTVPLPNGKVFWIFGDTPRYSYINGTWRLSNFIYGSSAGIGVYPAGKPPTKPFNEIGPGKNPAPQNQPMQFMSTPRLYVPDGSGRVCNKANAGPKAGADRWATGATLMPDKTNILISYIGVCVVTASAFGVESWGVAMFNWKTKKFSVQPYDVIPPATSGATLPHEQRLGSPIIANNKVTFFSGTQCDVEQCDAPREVYTTTVAATKAALKNPASYNNPTVVSGLEAVPNMSVAPKSQTRPYLTMYQFAGEHGQYKILKAPAPAGPWKPLTSGALPGCASASGPTSTPGAGGGCMSVALHPEFSGTAKLVVSYYVPDFGPGNASKYPQTTEHLGHVVLASLPG